MKGLLIVVALATLQGCTATHIVAGGPPSSPSFLILREDLILTSFTIACEEQEDSWRTHWKIVGETRSSVVDLGVLPDGMRTEHDFEPILSSDRICRVDVEARKQGGRRTLKYDVFVILLDGNVHSCSTRRGCIQELVETIT